MVGKKTPVANGKKAGQFTTIFKAIGRNHVYKGKGMIVKTIVLCFIPFLYAFIALWAFFNPLGNLNRLPIALVNSDTSAVGETRIINKDRLKITDVPQNNNGAYPFTIDNLKINDQQKPFTVFYYDDASTYLQHQNDRTFLTTIIIDQNFTHDFNHFFAAARQIILTHLENPTKIWAEIAKLDKPQVAFHASYKVNPILGEINEFALNALKDSIFAKFLPAVVSDQAFDLWHYDAIAHGDEGYKNLKDKFIELNKWLGIVIPGVGEHHDEFAARVGSVDSNEKIREIQKKEFEYWSEHSLIGPIAFIKFNVSIEGQDKAPYGFGLGPYFMCIGMWVGTLILTFTFLRPKQIAKTKFWVDYLAKTCWMIIFGLVQATILVTSLLLLFNSADLFTRSWQLFLFMWLVAIVFDLIIQAIAHMFRNQNIGRFLIVVLLILQLSGAGGTFPVELEPRFFQIIHNFLPFTHVINGLREILINPQPAVIGASIGYLLLFVFLLVPLSIFCHWRDERKLNGKPKPRRSKRGKNNPSITTEKPIVPIIDVEVKTTVVPPTTVTSDDAPDK